MLSYRIQCSRGSNAENYSGTAIRTVEGTRVEGTAIRTVGGTRAEGTVIRTAEGTRVRCELRLSPCSAYFPAFQNPAHFAVLKNSEFGMPSHLGSRISL